MKPLRLLFLTIFCFVIILIQIGFAQERCAPSLAELASIPAMNSNNLNLAKMVSQWNTVAKIPVPKKYHTIASYNGDVYVFAGVTTNDIYNSKCYKYNPLTDTWTTLADFPIANWLCGQAQVVNGKIYIFGGVQDFFIPLRNVYEYDPKTDKYVRKADMPINQALGVSGLIDGKIYIIAGNKSSMTDYSSTVQVYDPKTDEWSLATGYPKLVRYCAAANVNNKIIVTGGFNMIYPSYYVADTYIGELRNDTLRWTKGKNYPFGEIIFLSGIGIDDNAYFFGGRPRNDNNRPSSRRSYRYIPSLDKWETLSLKPTGMQALPQAGTDGKRIIVPGGADSTMVEIKPGDWRNRSLDITEVYDPSDQAAPYLVLSDTSFFVVMKRDNPVKKTLVIKNNGAATLTWSATINPACTWVSLSATSGSVGSVSSKPVDLNFSSTGITSGQYNTNLVLTTNDASHPTTTIPILFSLQDQDLDTDMNVLLEEGTGTWCGYCPYGGDSAKAIVERYQGRVISIAYHGGSTTEPMLTTFTDPWTKLVGLTGWPGAAINRIKFDGQTNIAISRDIWDAKCNSLISTGRSPVSLRVVDGGCNPTTHGGWMKVEIFFHQPMKSNLRLSIAQVEDSLNWTQTFYPPTGGTTKLYPYYHENVLRQLTPNGVDGDIISNGNLVATQSAITKTIFFTSKDSVRANNRFIIFVHLAGGQILQVIEHQFSLLSDTKDPVAVGDYSLSQNYPNPFRDQTAISYHLSAVRHVKLEVYNMLGRKLATLVEGEQDAGTHTITFDSHANRFDLQTGVYFYKLITPDFIETKKMILCN